MVFSSPIFIFGFLPAVLAVYYLSPRRLKNAVLLIFSLFFFYAWDKPFYAVIMMATTAFDYAVGLVLGRLNDSGRDRLKKLALTISVIVNIGLLAFFKYTDLFINGVNSLLDTGIPTLNLVLPIGISFYTFQAMSYTIDVYRGTASVQRSFVDFATYITMFPQLIAGPIVRYTTVEKELRSRQENFSDFGSGVVRFTVGLAKKVLIANQIGSVFDEISAMQTRPVLTAWLGAAAFAFQIYFDFSGYSDMAIGMGKMFGFKFSENFDLPYISKSITEFWRRWHISLGTWFKEYVYIPLGGNRRGIRRQILNLLIVWALTGFWHGASWNYLLWGLYFGVILILEKLFLLKFLDRAPKIVGHIYALFLILIGWVIFANENFGDMLRFFKNLFCSTAGIFNGYSWFLLRSNLVLWGLAAVCSSTLPKKLADGLKACLKSTAYTVVLMSFTVLLFLVSVLFMVGESYNPFLYFRF